MEFGGEGDGAAAGEEVVEFVVGLVAEHVVDPAGPLVGLGADVLRAPLSHAWDIDSVPSMGQRDDYVETSTMWHADLSRSERLDRWWSTASYGIGLADHARAAIARANEALAVAEYAQLVVRAQAVYALLAEKMSVREIAAKLGISKSEVGRISRSLLHDGELGNMGYLPPLGHGEAAHTAVSDAWGHPEPRT